MYYDGANWQWGDEMNLRFIERDGKKILQQAIDYGRSWEDVPCVVEKKEQRKLWEIIKDVPADWLYSGTYKDEAKAAIDAVIECYKEWESKCHPGAFPEYLKEKML